MRYPSLWRSSAAQADGLMQRNAGIAVTSATFGWCRGAVSRAMAAAKKRLLVAGVADERSTRTLPPTATAAFCTDTNVVVNVVSTAGRASNVVSLGSER